MRYFNHLEEQEHNQIFFIRPEEISLLSDMETLSHGLGATLYFPAAKSDFSDIFIQGKISGLMSAVICLEDSIDDSGVAVAEENLQRELKKIHEFYQQNETHVSQIPFLFVRVRNPEHLEKMIALLEPSLEILAGFVLPKFLPETGERYLKLIQDANHLVSTHTLYAMPILESPEIIHHESRRETLRGIQALVSKYSDVVLNIRIGATDFSGLFGLRRGHDYTVYDIQVLRDCIADILNMFSRSSQNLVVSGPVWEYFWSEERMLKPRLRATPFREHYGSDGDRVRNEMLNEYIDGLIQEAMLDKLNGIVGKTVIHPSHIIPVQAMYSVTHEDYMDAVSIFHECCNGNGVEKSSYSNRMNEKKPHFNWARKICTLAKIYGVMNPDYDHIRLIAELRRA